MDQLVHYLTLVLNFFREGFSHVNATQGLIIALLAALLASAWNRVATVALGATLVYLVADMIIPVLTRHAGFHVPPLTEASHWHMALSLFVGYLIAISVLMFVKRLFLTPATAH